MVETIATFIGILQGIQVSLLVLLSCSYTANPRKRAFPASLFTFFVVMLTFSYLDYFLSVFESFDMDRMEENKGLCQFQGYFLTYSTNSSALWGLCTSINLYLTVVKEKSRTDRYYKFYHILCWGFPVIQCLSMVATDVGPLGMWCWIQNPPAMRIMGLYIVFILGGSIVTFCSLFTMLKLLKQQKQLNQRKSKLRKIAAMLKMSVFLLCYGGVVILSSLARVPTFFKSEIDEEELREIGTTEYASALFGFIICFVFGPAEENAEYLIAFITGQFNKQYVSGKSQSTNSRFSQSNKKSNVRTTQLEESNHSSEILVDSGE